MEENKKPFDYSDVVKINTTSDEGQIFLNTIWLELNRQPSVYKLSEQLSRKKFDKWLSQYPDPSADSYLVRHTRAVLEGKHLVRDFTLNRLLEEGVWLQYSVSSESEDVVDGVSFVYDPVISEQEIESRYVSKLTSCKTRQGKPTFYVITTAYGGYALEAVEVKYPNIDIGLNYGDDFVEMDKKIVSRLKRDKSGLMLFNGEPGTGKTTYIRHLIKKIYKKKCVIYVPPNMVDHVASPEFIGFLMENRNSVLIIEDAEDLLQNRDVSASTGISNLLNMTDGLLSDCLNFTIIATFNSKTTGLDKALLRPGRLFVHKEFGPLSAEQATKVMRHVKPDFEGEAKAPMVLSDIYAEAPMLKVEAPKRIGLS